MKKKANKNWIYILLISILSLLVIILVTIIIISKPSLKNVITTNRKTNETVVSTKTIEEESDLKNAISKVYNSVVYIQVEVMSRMGTQAASGSGFVYKKDSKNAYILTNNHVVEDASKIVVTYIDGSETEAEVVGKDEFSDISVLKVKADTVLAVAELGSSDEAEIGDTVFTVGAPLGKEYMGTITKGIVSGINRKVNVTLNNGSYLMETIQTDATDTESAAGKNAIISAGTARNSTVRACAAHLQTGPVSDGAIHRMSATSAETAEYARWSGRTTSRSRQTPWQSGAMPKLEASRKQTLWSWKLWMHSFLR